MFISFKPGARAIILVVIALQGCGFLEPTPDNSQIATAAVQTYQANETAQARMRPSDTAAPLPSEAPTSNPTETMTATLAASDTPTLTSIPTLTPDPGWPGRWTFFLLMLSGQPFDVELVQQGDRITSNMLIQGQEYFLTGVLDTGGGQVNGAVYMRGEMKAYFTWQMQSGRNLFLGRWWHGDQSGAWCGGRRGVLPPPEDQCLLRP
jgi:hypothetical protein